MNSIRSMLVSVSAVIAALAISSSARAELLVYEPFDYAPGPNALNGQDGGTGFAGTWGFQGADVLEGSFSYVDAMGNQLATTGNRAFMDPVDPNDANAPGSAVSPIRNIAPIPPGTETLYISFLAQQTAGTLRDLSVSLFTAANDPTNPAFGNTAERITIGHGNGFDTWGAYAMAVGDQGAYSDTLATELSLLVLRIDANANGDNERFRLYVNPLLGEEPAVADAESDAWNFVNSLSDFTRLRMRGGGSNGTYPASWLEADEIRIGTTYASVTPFVAALLPGDANRDGRVDGEDFLIWQAAFGTQSGATWDDGDFNGDGRVDGEDFLIWQAHFGSVASSSAVTPEPSVLSLLMLAGAGLLARRRSVGPGR